MSNGVQHAVTIGCSVAVKRTTPPGPAGQGGGLVLWKLMRLELILMNSKPKAMLKKYLKNPKQAIIDVIIAVNIGMLLNTIGLKFPICPNAQLRATKSRPENALAAGR